jgi:uncharacterized protein YukE
VSGGHGPCPVQRLHQRARAAHHQINEHRGVTSACVSMCRGSLLDKYQAKIKSISHQYQSMYKSILTNMKPISNQYQINFKSIVYHITI